jgi:hypothetical protein
VVGAGESQACAAAAKDRVEVLEQEAETTATEHQQAVDAAADTLKAAQEAATQQLQEAQEAAAAQLQQANEQREAEIGKVQAELAAVKVPADAAASLERVPGRAYSCVLVSALLCILCCRLNVHATCHCECSRTPAALLLHVMCAGCRGG